jgi:hypothetical protein
MDDKVIYLADAMLCCCATLGFLIPCLKSTKGRGGRQIAKSDDIRRPALNPSRKGASADDFEPLGKCFPPSRLREVFRYGLVIWALTVFVLSNQRREAGCFPTSTDCCLVVERGAQESTVQIERLREWKRFRGGWSGTCHCDTNHVSSLFQMEETKQSEDKRTYFLHPLLRFGDERKV